MVFSLYRDQLTSADPFNPEPFSVLFQRHLFQHLSSYKLSRLITQHFKHHLRRKLFTLDRKFLLKRYAQVPWHLSPSPHHFDALHRTSLKVVPASCRLATLRWSIDSEPDAHFRLRRFLSRRSPCRCGCGIISAFYPDGISNGSLAPTHLTPAISWRLHLPPALPPMFSHLSNLPAHPPLPAPTRTTWTSRKGHSIASLSLILPPSEQAWAHHPCVLCGAGDNSVQHWLLFCPVPAMAGSLLLKTPWKSQTWYLSALLPLNKLALICSLWAATRQVVHERSGLPPPSLALPPASSDSLPTIALQLLLRALDFCPSPFRPSLPHLPTPAPPPHTCYFELYTFHLRTLEREGLPIYYGHTPLASQDIPAQYRLGTLAPHSPSVRKLFQFQKAYPQLSNCTISYSLCQCGHIHAILTSLSPISKGSGRPPLLGLGLRPPIRRWCL